MSSLSGVKKVVIIGSGITGLAAASFLDEQGVQVILLEKDSHIGGHCYTFQSKDKQWKCDLGFMVLSPVTYNNFLEWLKKYDIMLEDSNMSFSVNMGNGFEWNSNWIFNNIQMFFTWDLWKMVWDLCRYQKILNDEIEGHFERMNNINKEDHKMADDVSFENVTEFYQSRYNFSDAFLKYFLIPQSAATWSMSASEVRHMSAEFIQHFSFKHALANIFGRPIWKSIKGKSQAYVQKVLRTHFSADENIHANVAGIHKKNKYFTNFEVISLQMLDNEKIKVVGIRTDTTKNIQSEEYFVVDHVLFCCHPCFILRILNHRNGIKSKPTANEQEILNVFKAGENTVILHSDESILNVKKRNWTAWNYHSSPSGTLNVTYWLNLLQNMKESEHVPQLFATLNPSVKQQQSMFQKTTEKKSKVHHVWHTQHPIFTNDSWKVMKYNLLDTIQNKRGLSFAGAWTSYGFHRDGFLSGMKEAHNILGMEFKPEPVVIHKNASYYFSWMCCIIHTVILCVLGFFVDKRWRTCILH